MAGFELFQVEMTKTYTQLEWRDDVRAMLRRAGDVGTPIVFLFGDHQIKVRGPGGWGERGGRGKARGQ